MTEQEKKNLAVPSEDLGEFPTSHVDSQVSVNTIPGYLLASSGLLYHSIHVQIDMPRGKKNQHIENKT